jgi:hypothetical protein
MLLVGLDPAAVPVESDETRSAAGQTVRSLTKSMRWLLYAAATLVFLAGIELFILTEQTATYFAWTISLPFTAAFLGAAYWAAVAMEIIAARQKVWARARVAIPGIWLFTVLTLVVTLLNFARFHFTSPELSARGSAFLWLGIYTVVPVAILFVGYLQLRSRGSDPDRLKTLPGWLRIAFLTIGVGMVATGIALFAAPNVIGSSWPWALTSLTAQAIGAWFIGIGVTALFAIRENDFARIGPVGGACTLFGALEVVALLRYAGSINWSNPAAWIYLGLLITLLPLGVYVWFTNLRMDERLRTPTIPA